MAQRLVAHRLAVRHISGAEQNTQFSDRFDQASNLHAKSLVILMVPMLALALAVFFLRSNKFVAEHIVFSLHFYAWWLLWVLTVLVFTAITVLACRAGGFRMPIPVMDILATSLEFGGFAVYLFFALRSFYKARVVPALVKAGAMAWIGFYLLFVYRFILFFTVLYTT